MSDQEKVKVRAASAAFDTAFRTVTKDDDSDMRQLQKAIDVISEGEPKDEFLRCQTLLVTYRSHRSLISIDTDTELRRAGRKMYTAQDFKNAMGKATEKDAFDLQRLSTCSSDLSKLAN